MLVLSFNARGLRSFPKIKDLKIMVDILKPMIIFIQETMMEGDKAKEVLEPCLRAGLLVSSVFKATEEDK